MQQPFNYPYPQIYWVDSSAPNPWASPGSVFPCQSAVPGRPGQRRQPPPPPPPSLRPPPPPPPPLELPPFSLPSLKKRRKRSKGLYLLVLSFLVAVALVGLGTGMFQLFHLQKELAALRESSGQVHSESSLEKQIGQPCSPCEKKELRNVAHLTGNDANTRQGKPCSNSMTLQWEDTSGIALVTGVKYEKGGVVINDTGLYFVYSKVYFRSQACNNQPLSHKVYKKSSTYPKDWVLMEDKMMNYCTTGQMWAHSSYLGAVFNLTSADSLYVNVSQSSLVSLEESKTFFGLYKL